MMFGKLFGGDEVGGRKERCRWRGPSMSNAGGFAAKTSDLVLNTADESAAKVTLLYEKCNIQVSSCVRAPVLHLKFFQSHAFH